jgi:hypothetical protein
VEDLEKQRAAILAAEAAEVESARRGSPANGFAWATGISIVIWLAIFGGFAATD